ncbi:hypothetical protein HDU93_006790, partial [Gonapodya sp. JEL0774]
MVRYLLDNGMTGNRATEVFLAENAPPESEVFDLPPEDEMLEDEQNAQNAITQAASQFTAALRSTAPSLRNMLDEIDLLLYPLLRWIIASNRAYFRELWNPEERLAGLDKRYIQFKMVMGSLEKEEQFVKEKAGSSKRPQSIYAFHGSPLRNWHSIIRNGLHFKNIMHGRAYGNGIYHSPQLSTSQGYAQFNYQSVP